MALTATAAPDVKPPGAVIGPVAARSQASGPITNIRSMEWPISDAMLSAAPR